MAGSLLAAPHKMRMRAHRCYKRARWGFGSRHRTFVLNGETVGNLCWLRVVNRRRGEPAVFRKPGNGEATLIWPLRRHNPGVLAG